ncbi:PREDICTED: pentatricopeptide repeat-containing protein At3g60980, mitochondrial-like [Camelina sativa]|uniref:Pentatricopeptide repeat-containing protein At3g60980, mitochondrial-like n=1 Tax=Camelina sativa TaxID=90675 RepID=A0ABM1RNZ2_CAMSA|nr:PREDICTED: pentatricopeptide repeat-containing protein At3g60980, mitochondrial-like [Camelina sativa]
MPWTCSIISTAFPRLHLAMPLLEWLLRQGDFEKANEVLGDLLGSSHVHGDGYDVVAIFSYTYLKYWFEQGKEDKAMHCYSRLQLRKLTKATVVNALLALLLKYGKKTEAWSLFDQVLHSKEMDNVNHYTLNIVVNEFFKIGRFDLAIQIFHKVKALKLKFPHVVTCYRNIITRLNKQGILFEAEHLFQEMCSDELVSPDVSTYTSMIDAYLKAGRNEDALRLSNKMVDAFLGQLARLACL